jgi:hypothetical protein
MRPTPSIVVKALGVLLLAALAIGAATGSVGAQGYNDPTPTKPTLSLKLVKKQTPKKVRKKGLKVRATCSTVCRVGVQALKGSKVVGTAVKNLPAKAGTIKVKLTSSARKSLKRKRTARFRVVAAAQDASGQTSNVVDKRYKVKKKRKR